MIKFLTPEQLQGFENYKYSAVDTNPLSVYVIHPFWNAVVKLLPEWVAPNLLTMSGFLCVFGNFLILSLFDNEFYASSDDHPEFPPVPRWIWLLIALNVFMAHTLDGIDGKQARRTKTSGPLGELFDHGLDSWTTVFIPTCLYSVFGRSDFSISPWRMYFCLWNVFACFFLSHWEKYNTGYLFLPWGYDYSMVASVFVFMTTFVSGYHFWKFNVHLGSYSMPAGAVFELLMYVGSLGLTLPMALWNVYKSYRDETGKMRNFWEATRPFVPLVFQFVFSMLWVYTSRINVLESHPRLLYYFTGTVFSNISCRLIVHQMCGTRCDVFNVTLLPLILGASLVAFVPQAAPLEYSYLQISTAAVTFYHVFYGVTVVRQMCQHFNIFCFQIKKKED